MCAKDDGAVEDDMHLLDGVEHPKSLLHCGIQRAQAPPWGEPVGEGNRNNDEAGNAAHEAKHIGAEHCRAEGWGTLRVQPELGGLACIYEGHSMTKKSCD
jgi:hypothetical protein